MLREGMKEYTFRADFSPGKNVLNLVVKSISKPFTGEIKMKKWPSGWKLKGARRESSGKTTKVEFTFDLNAPLSPDGDYRFVFTVKGKEYEFVCRPYIAN
jgi:hypothetical protein